MLLPRMLLMIGEYDNLRASTEKLRKRFEEGAQGRVLPTGRTFEGVGDAWDEQAFKAGAKGFCERGGSVRDGGRVDTKFRSRSLGANKTFAVVVPIYLVIIFPQFSVIKWDLQVFPIQSGLPSVFDRPSGKVILPQHYTWGFGDSR